MQPNALSRNTGYNVSSKYAVINTAELVQQFETAGYKLQRVQWARVKNAEKSGAQKHLLTFTTPTYGERAVGDVVPQIILKNSYDGTSSFQLYLGLYRLVCANGLMVGSTFFSKSVRHVGANAVAEAIGAADAVARQAGPALELVQSMRNLPLHYGEQVWFASQAANLLQLNATQRQVDDLLQPARSADNGNSLWLTYNVIQERVMRGGMRYTIQNELGQFRNQRTRAITSVQRTVELNQGLWDLAQTFLQEKGA